MCCLGWMGGWVRDDDDDDDYDGDDDDDYYYGDVT